jgi:catechol 2,3-dioxygenase-like lactoylglutathione lyase family enzyme
MSADTIDWQGVGQIAIVVHDLERQVAFYRDTLGFPFLFQIPNSAFFQAGSVRLMLSRPEKPEFDHPPSILYYKVGDIQAAHRTLVSRGVRFEGEPHFLAKMPDHDLWMAFFYDAEDNMMALMSEVR